MSAHARRSIAARREDRELAELIRFLDALTGDEPPGGLIEVRYREPGATMGQRFHRADRPELAARLILLLAQRHDVYVGCAPRRRRWGGRQAIERAWALWADCDGADASARLARFEPQAAIVVGSGIIRSARVQRGCGRAVCCWRHVVSEADWVARGGGRDGR